MSGSITSTVKSEDVLMVDGEAGKGDKYRKIDFKKWDEGWESAFGKGKKNDSNRQSNPSKTAGRISQRKKKSPPNDK